MKRKFLLVFAAFLAMTFVFGQANAQTDKMIGLWKTIDDETGEAKSHVKIVKGKDGMFYGKIVELLLEPQDKLCDKCEGDLKDKKIVGMVILRKMKVDGDKLGDGKILDPGNGKFYNCSMEIDEDDPDKLNLRGSIDRWGIAGRTQSWFRVK